MQDGSKQYAWLGLQEASAAWKEIKYEINMPVGAQSAVVYQYVTGNGFLQLDDMSLGGYVAPPPPAATNVIPNGNVEAVGLDGLPTNWNSAAWGKNTVVHRLAPGRNSTYSMRVEFSNYVSGNAKWITAAIPVEAGKYKYR
jgi:hypothetical protein